MTLRIRILDLVANELLTAQTATDAILKLLREGAWFDGAIERMLSILLELLHTPPTLVDKSAFFAAENDKELMRKYARLLLHAALEEDISMKCQARYSVPGYPSPCTKAAEWLVETPSLRRRLCCYGHLPYFMEGAGTNRVTRLTDCCQCAACLADGPHASDCAVHNEPAYANRPCTCGGING